MRKKLETLSMYFLVFTKWGKNQYSSIEIILFFLVFYGQLADAHIMVNMKREDTFKINNTAIFFYLGGTKLNDLIISNKIDRNEGFSSTARLSEAMINKRTRKLKLKIDHLTVLWNVPSCINTSSCWPADEIDQKKVNVSTRTAKSALKQRQ